jgi:hypothetical protein
MFDTLNEEWRAPGFDSNEKQEGGDDIEGSSSDDELDKVWAEYAQIQRHVHEESAAAGQGWQRDSGLSN